jgi:hypothetical protein
MSSHLLFKSPDGQVVKVKVGFSWQAFFVGSFKAVVKRTWLLVALAALVYFAVAWMGASITASSRSVALLVVLLFAYLGYMLFCGLYGNRWLVSSLLRRGFRQVGEDKR